MKKNDNRKNKREDFFFKGAKFLLVTSFLGIILLGTIFFLMDSLHKGDEKEVRMFAGRNDGSLVTKNNFNQVKKVENRTVLGELKTAIVDMDVFLCTLRNATCQTMIQQVINVPEAGTYKFKVEVERGNNTDMYECQAHEEYYMVINGQRTPVIPDPGVCEWQGTINNQVIPGNYSLRQGNNVIKIYHQHIGKDGVDLRDGKPKVSIDSLKIKKIEYNRVLYCGDGIVNGNEQCDNGANNGAVCTPAYGETCEYCTNSCTRETVTGGSCGDGIVNGNEQCDNGANNGAVCTPAYGETCEYCTNSCTRETVTGGNCGDGIVNGNEQCDNGASNGAVCTPAYGETCEYCTNSCTRETVTGGNCGDGIVNGNEQCDNGASNGAVCTPAYGETCEYCTNSCTRETVTGGNCGDGIVNGNEQCDNGASNGAVCTPAYGETCEYCTNSCTRETVTGGSCGDGIVNGNEQCDNGASNGAVCTPAYGETCEYCTNSCTTETVTGGSCGNGVVEDDEECDNGSDNGVVPSVSYGETKTYCKADCSKGTVVGGQCGNGTLEGSEACDDGNLVNGDGCDASCQIEEKEEPRESSCDSSIGNYIWYDANSNGIQESIEEGIPNIKVCAFNGNKKYCDTTNSRGRYKIKDLCPGTYDVRVKGVGSMIQTYDPDGKLDNKTKVKLKNNDKHTKADFGYRGVAPKTGLATNILLLVGVSSVITIGILLLMNKYGKI